MPSAQFLEIVHRSPNLSIGTHGSLLVLCFRSEVSMAALEAAESAQTRLLARNPSGILLLTIIDSGVPVPPDGARRMVADTFRRMAARNKAAATVILGDGFWASAIRSTLTALSLIVRPPCPQRTLARVDEALDWLGEIDRDLAAKASRLGLAVESLRAA